MVGLEHIVMATVVGVLLLINNEPANVRLARARDIYQLLHSTSPTSSRAASTIRLLKQDSFRSHSLSPLSPPPELSSPPTLTATVAPTVTAAAHHACDPVLDAVPLVSVRRRRHAISVSDGTLPNIEWDI